MAGLATPAEALVRFFLRRPGDDALIHAPLETQSVLHCRFFLDGGFAFVSC
jgi:hypothetical protein